MTTGPLFPGEGTPLDGIAGLHLLDTPALVVDARRLGANLARMQSAADRWRLDLRPHAKTHKSAAIATRQLAAGARGLTVATIGEAEHFARAGVGDLFVAYPTWVDRRRGARLAELSATVALSVGVDSVEAARALAANAAGAPLRVLVEVDSGHHRSGVAPAGAGAVARAASDAGLEVGGVFTFPGHGYAPGAAGAAAGDEAAALARAVASLEDAGLPCPVASGGSTPTALLADHGVLTELRPGVYAFNDAQQLRLGSCRPEDVALVVVATVVSTPAPDRLVLDAGSKAIGADRPAWLPGHGLLPSLPGGVVEQLSEHHAVVALDRSCPRRPAVGSRLALVPNHVCAAVNLADELVVVADGAVVDRWPLAPRSANR